MSQKKGLRYCIWILVLISSIPLSLALGSMFTGSLAPAHAHVCGPFAKNLTLTASNVWNAGSVQLVDTNATILIQNGIAQGGLLVLTKATVSLGTLNASQKSATSPSWIISCNESFPANYTLYINYTSAAGPAGSSIDQAISVVQVHPVGDATPPSIVGYSPTQIIHNTFVTLNVTTNENATCKYSLSQNIAFDSMGNQFSITGGTTHRNLFTGLADGTHHYYVKCKDAAGNKATVDGEAIIAIDLAPSAKITLSDESPVHAGTVTVTVATSEKVQATPQLTFRLDNGTTKGIALSGADTSWEGFMVIDSSDHNTIGSFSFSATDLTGNQGNIITSGNVFVVDTEGPLAPTDVSAGHDRGEVKVTWIHERNDVDFYRIYRGTTEEVTFFITTTKTTFFDTSVVTGQTYTYAVSAVDKAGNEGPLSDKVSLVVSSTGPSFSSTVNNGLANLEVLEDVSSPKEITAVIDDIDDLINEIDKIKRKFLQDQADITKLLGADKRFREGRVALLALQEDLEGVKDTDPAEIGNLIKAAQDKINLIKESIPRSIQLLAEQADQSSSSEADIALAVDAIINAAETTIPEGSTEEYIAATAKLQERVTIVRSVSTFEVEALDKSTRTIYLIKDAAKMSGEPILDGHMITIVPKQVATDVDQLHFPFGGIKILQKDPIFQREFSGLEAEVTFSFENDLESARLNDIKTVVVEDASSLLQGNEGSFFGITGLSILEPFGGNGPYAWIFLASLALVVGLTIYYFFFVEVKKPPQTNNPETQPKQTGSWTAWFAKIKNGYHEKLKNAGNHGKSNLHPHAPLNHPHSKAATSAQESLPRQGIDTAHETFHYPHFAIEDYNKVGLQNLGDIHVPMLYHKANLHINNLDLTNAMVLYQTMLSNQEAQNQAPKKNLSQKKLKRLHQKISLLLKTKQTEYCMRKGDYGNLKYLLNGIASHYNKIIGGVSEEELRLLSHAREYHTVCSGALLKNRH